jgi:hypothetical protein
LKFSKNAQKCTDTFYYKEEPLESVNSYKYLGIEFTSSGNFNAAQESLVAKASKAMFKLNSFTHTVNLKASAKLKLFDHLVAPILLYGCEIWGPKKIKLSKNNNFQFFNLCDKLPAEKLHLKFCRYIIGCNKSSSKAAVRGELGRYPLLLRIWVQSCKYWTHINSKNEDTLVYHARVAQESTKAENTWYNNLTHMLQFCGLDNSVLQETKMSTPLLNRLKDSVKGLYHIEWLNHIKSNKKLKDTYAIHKMSISYEKA